MKNNTKHNKPLVTVVIPVYNGAKFLEEAVSSVLKSTYPNYEILLINDGSKDDSRRIIESFSDSRIRIINQENH